MAVLYAPPTKNGVQKTLAAQLLNTASTGDAITFDDVDGLANLPGVLVINRVDSNGVATPSAREYISYSGTSGTTVLIETRNVDNSGAARTHAVGSIVEFLPDVVWADSIYDTLSNAFVPSTQALDTTKVVTPTASQTLTNKTLTSPVLNTGVSGTAVLDEDDMTSNSATKLATQQSIKAYVDASSAPGGWTTYSAVTPTSGTLDDPTFPIVFAGVDLTSTLYPGMRVRITQSTVKYFIITAVAFSTDTTVTLYGGTDYDLVATGTTAISAFAYSGHKAPAGFPLSPVKWSVEVTDTTSRNQTPPTQNTWYNLGSISISIPIGIWRTSFSVYHLSGDNSATSIDIFTTLSTANNSESDADFTVGSQMDGASANLRLYSTVYREKTLTLAAKTSYYLVSRTTLANMEFIFWRNDLSKLIIRAVCAYL